LKAARQERATGRIAVDIGGTFTDIICCPEGSPAIARKVLSTPENYARSVIEALRALIADSGLAADSIGLFVHATTVATNAVLERKGASTALITTEGFRDVLEIGRLRLPVLYDLNWKKPPALVPRERVFEVAERCDPEGKVLVPVSLDRVREVLDAASAAGVASVAVSFLHSYANPAHEEAVAALVRAEFPQMQVSLSSDLVREIREFERTSTAVVDAYVKPVVHHYLSLLESGVAALGLRAPMQLMQSSGGLMDLRTAANRPVHLLESGPAAGVVGVNHAAGSSGDRDVLSFDMGGTTAKAALVENGEFHRSGEFEVGGEISATSRVLRGGGYLIRLPVIDVAEVGTGGGSIAWVDAGGALQVGPRSAGAAPGPVCYGLGGTEPTVTDANVVLGYLDPDTIGRGILRPDPDGAWRAIERRIGKPTGMSVEKAAHAIHTVANATMMRALRAVSTERGRDLRRFTLYAFGGSGPVHGANLALALRMPHAVIPRFPGLFSAYGLLPAKVEARQVQTYLRRLTDVDPGDLARQYELIASQATASLVNQGYDRAQIRVRRYADLRYVGQQYELLVMLPDDTGAADGPRALAEAFAAEHRRTYGYVNALPVQAVNLRAVAVLSEGFVPPSGQAWSGYRPLRQERQVYFADAAARRGIAVVARDDLRNARVGPLLIEEFDTTTVVPPGASAMLDPQGQIRIDLPAA
jgi:N-methylhydantoinase A